MLFSFVASFFVLACTLLLQWLVYDDWLHQTGPLHMVGGAVAAVLTFMFIFGWQSAIREQQAEMLRRFETIAELMTAFATPCKSLHVPHLPRTQMPPSTFGKQLRS